MAETATKERPNKVKITDIGPSLKKIHIEIPAESVAEQLGTSIDTLLVEAELPGFRKGRAPKRLVEKRFGATIRREAKNQLVATAYSKAVEDNKLRVIGDPSSPELEKLEVQEGKPLAFEIEVEVSPEFTLPSLDGVEVKKPTLVTTDEMVDKEVERLLLNEGSLQPKETPDKGDYLTGHAVMKDEAGKTVLDINDAVIQIPSGKDGDKGMILGVLVDDFASQLKSPKVGETVTIRTTGPENHENESVRGKNVAVTFHIKRADQIIPASINDIAQRFGLENPQQVKDAVRQRIDERVKVEQQSAMRSQVARHLLDNTTMELPARITANQAARNLERRRIELMYRGVDAQQIEEHVAELRSSSADVAARELKLFFILDKAAENLDVKITDAELNGRIAQIAFSRGERPERLRQDLINRGQIGTVFQQIREHKTMDAILAKAKVSEVSAEEFNKLMGETADQAKASKPKAPAKKPEAKAEAEESAKPKTKSKKKSDE